MFRQPPVKLNFSFALIRQLVMPNPVCMHRNREKKIARGGTQAVTPLLVTSVCFIDTRSSKMTGANCLSKSETFRILTKLAAYFFS